MNANIAQRVSQELTIAPSSVVAVLSLLEQDATVPFIARYRKEATGSLDEEAIFAIKERYSRIEELEARKKAVLSSLEERSLLSSELEERVRNAPSLTLLEDIYLPFRPKRKTRASVAGEKGLAPLAEQLLLQKGDDPASLALPFVSEERGVASGEEALQGALDIIAERISEHGEARRKMRLLFGRREKSGAPSPKGRKRKEPTSGITSHGRNQPLRLPPTESWPCSGEKRKKSSAFQFSLPRTRL